MDLEWQKMIETNIYDHISTIDYNHPDFNITTFKESLKSIVGMVPAVKIKWSTTEKINELKRDAGVKDYIEKTDKPETIDITFVDSENNPYNLQFIL